MRRVLVAIGTSVSALLAIGLAGLIGLVSASGLIMAPADAAAIAAVEPVLVPAYDPGKPTVAILLGDTRTEATDFLAPYSMFSESGAYNVYAVAASHAVRTLAGGVDVVPQLTFAELQERLGRAPDITVVPAILAIRSPQNAAVLDWLRQQGRAGTLLFSWCAGAEVLAASGLIDGRSVTTHWSDIDRFEGDYPAVTWLRGLRYVDEGDLLTTGGITAGVDATLHLLARLDGQAVADRVADAMHYPVSPFASDPRAPQYTTEPVDAAVYLHMAFDWPKPRAAVWLYDGVGEVDLAAAVEAFGLTSVYQTLTVAPRASVVSAHGLQLVPRAQVAAAPVVDQVLVPGGDGARDAARTIPGAIASLDRISVLQDDTIPTYAFTLAIRELARTHDVWTATYAARQLEVRDPLQLSGPQWPTHLVMIPLLVALAAVMALWTTGIAVRSLLRLRRRHPLAGNGAAARTYSGSRGASAGR